MSNTQSQLSELITNTTAYKTPNDRFEFIPQAPYDDYTKGVVVVINRDRSSIRRYVQLSGSSTNSPRFKKLHAFARYAYQVHLWKTQQYIIPNTLEVDHQNNDAMDDRIDNYQLLTRDQNAHKQRLLRGALIAVMICPVCLSHFEKPARTTQYAECHKSKKLIFYCGTRCHMASEFAMPSREQYRDLRGWISDNQIYKLVRVWTTGETKFEGIVSDKMLAFNLSQASGTIINYGSAKFASPNERKVMIRDYRSQGMQFAEIARKMDLDTNTVWQLADEPIQKVHLKPDELNETLARIKRWRNDGYSQARIGKLLGIPRTSVSKYIRHHAEEWDIDNDKPAAKGDSIVTLVCPNCHCEFDRSIRLTQLLASRAGRIMCCCKDCRWDLRIKMNKIEKREEMRLWLSENQAVRVDKLMPNGNRFFDRLIPHDERIRTIDILTFDPVSRA